MDNDGLTRTRVQLTIESLASETQNLGRGRTMALILLHSELTIVSRNIYEDR
jgi:hypothetical protein